MEDSSVLSESSRDNIPVLAMCTKDMVPPRDLPTPHGSPSEAKTPVLTPRPTAVDTPLNLPTETVTPMPTPPKEPLAVEEPSSSDQFICYVCRRKLGSAEMLKKHQELSSLHQKNLRIIKHAAQKKRHELRSDVVRLRHMVEHGSPSVGRELQRLEFELGSVQSDLEGSLREEKVMEIGPFVIDIGGLTWTGNKSSNEDRMSLVIDISENVKACMIADGHCGDVCADYLIQHLGNNVRQSFEKTGDIRAALKEGFLKTDSDFIEFAVANEIPSGSTAIMAVFFLDPSEGTLQCMMAHVGDSRGLVARNSSSSVLRVTEDHKPDRPDEKLRLQQSGGHVVDVCGIWRVFTPNIVSIGGRTLQWGLAVSRAFGDLALKKPRAIVIADPEISDQIAIEDSGVVVLACDGIFDVMNDQETVEAARQGGPAAILRIAYGKLSDDNLTAIVCSVKTSSKLQRRPSVLSEPCGKKQRFRESVAPEMVPPSQQI